MLEAKGLLSGESLLLTVSRITILAGWLIALLRIWAHRAHPHANQALAGALAMVLAEALLLSGADLPHDGVVFFIAIAQLTIAISVSRILSASRLADLAAERNGAEPGRLSGLYLRSIIVVAAMGAVFSAIQSWILAQ